MLSFFKAQNCFPFLNKFRLSNCVWWLAKKSHPSSETTCVFIARCIRIGSSSWPSLLGLANTIRKIYTWSINLINFCIKIAPAIFMEFVCGILHFSSGILNGWMIGRERLVVYQLEYDPKAHVISIPRFPRSSSLPQREHVTAFYHSFFPRLFDLVNANETCLVS